MSDLAKSADLLNLIFVIIGAIGMYLYQFLKSSAKIDYFQKSLDDTKRMFSQTVARLEGKIDEKVQSIEAEVSGMTTHWEQIAQNVEATCEKRVKKLNKACDDIEDMKATQSDHSAAITANSKAISKLESMDGKLDILTELVKKSLGAD